MSNYPISLPNRLF
uniref:Uncharacterized protein n=1 Tax=Anguilla anguilla TaxID=7936 RepID=A0A0E9RM91_ANGAN